ncbi:3-hydroxyacyl-CoA dehydrogenase NAD-binding domain-containing protein [Hyphobacterium sp. HN65]|uniref:3-hydroxyacyl-CoA dehydrogenase NAD-binding domain-containing protein n=1 Tax=Hyphobacterium lacteum TaxID=3116575 RepID=A0ABU7LNQ4_9PROT|nr:3-hydroxyacyl-CoA dehydrogenase NAD-binding domain-containing protein [Hyphobacterium sp. HN65]MEE2524969.1 3-hydroxyacyl-CoA dehydrogenase NAD-binding domain-containing protein [Hyphobacterium sp. HN65]
MSDIVTSEQRGDVLIIRVNNPPVNALGIAVREGVTNALADVGNAKAAVLHCEGRTFFAGADITEFGKPPQSPSLNDMIEALENCPIPVIAAMHGTSLGGGLETALGCDYRIIDRKGRVGFPEIELGIFPGAGGTQRSPRLCGIPESLKMTLDGKPITAARAVEIGLCDEISDGDILENAIAFAETKTEKHVVRDLPVPACDQAELEKVLAAAQKSRRGQIAVENATRAVLASAEMDFDSAMENERKLFMELLNGSQARAMRHMFFAERLSAKVDGLDAQPGSLGLIGVVGSGTMGGGIAMAFANAGFAVRIHDANAEALKAGLEKIRALYLASASKGRISEAEALDRFDRIQPIDSWDGFAACDLIIEAVFERMDVKKAVFAELDAVARPDAIIATNTSYLDVDEIAAGTKDPARVLGMHFFSPANVMRLLEIVRGAKTSGKALVTALDAAKRIRKVPVVSGVCHGFIGNRMLKGYGREAGLCMMEGAAPQDVDKALYDFGMPMGPLAMGDLAGLDIGYDNRRSMVAGEDYEPLASVLQDRLVEMGRKGQKTSAGIYKYEASSRAPIPDPEVDALIENIAQEQGVARRPVSADEIVERCMLALINEGARILEEGIAQRASDIDVVYVNGYGFPRYRGGPMFYADELGLAHVLERTRHYQEKFGPKWWTPAPLLEKLAAENSSFGAWKKG